VFERFTDRARLALVEAQTESAESTHGFLGTEHILIGLVRLREGLAHDVLAEFGVALEPLRQTVAARLEELVRPGRELAEKDALATIGIDLDAVRSRVEQTFGPGALPDPVTTPAFTPLAKQSLDRAFQRALVLRHRYIGTEHVLLGVLEVGEGLACQALADLDVDLDAIDAVIVARAAPEEARVSAAWRDVVDLHTAVRQLDDESQMLAQSAIAHLSSRHVEAITYEQAEVNRLAADTADTLHAAATDARAALANLGITV
jgi:ATP-dependent Clp protease ATP-binding subunit ClpA